MARKKIKLPRKTQMGQLLSPKEYLCKKARNLPMEVCYLHEKWDEKGMTTVIVVRSHKNGNKTIGIYLVDLYCLGVKDTFYLFNVPESQLQHLLDQNPDLIQADYPLVHHLIYGAIEYADRWGFEPHKDWKLTQYLLEPENHAIPEIDITFGKDGKPFYVSGPNDDPHKTNGILRTLENTAGTGNFHYIVEGDKW